MLIHSIPILIALGACTTIPDLTPDAPRPDPLLETPQSDTKPSEAPRHVDVCALGHHTCLPLDPASQAICDYACLLPSYCLDYYASDYAWCAAHPDTFDHYYRYCDPRGNPTWETYCVEGQRP